jgi:hypothetical protein
MSHDAVPASAVHQDYALQLKVGIITARLETTPLQSRFSTDPLFQSINRRSKTRSLTAPTLSASSLRLEKTPSPLDHTGWQILFRVFVPAPSVEARVISESTAPVGRYAVRPSKGL